MKTTTTINEHFEFKWIDKFLKRVKWNQDVSLSSAFDQLKTGFLNTRSFVIK